MPSGAASVFFLCNCRMLFCQLYRAFALDRQPLMMNKKAPGIHSCLAVNVIVTLDIKIVVLWENLERNVLPIEVFTLG